LPGFNIKSYPKEKWGWLWGPPEILRFSFNIYATADINNFKIGKQLGFAKAHHKITPKEKWAWSWDTVVF